MRAAFHRAVAERQLPSRHGPRPAGNRQVETCARAGGGALRRGDCPRRPLPPVRRGHHLPAARGDLPRGGGRGASSRRHSRRVHPRRSRGRSGRRSSDLRASDRSRSSSRTSTGPSRRSSTCSNTSWTGLGTRRSCSSASRVRICSTSARRGALIRRPKRSRSRRCRTRSPISSSAQLRRSLRACAGRSFQDRGDRRGEPALRRADACHARGRRRSRARPRNASRRFWPRGSTRFPRKSARSSSLRRSSGSNSSGVRSVQWLSTGVGPRAPGSQRSSARG